MKLIKSKYLVEIKDTNKSLVYHSLLNKPRVLTNDMVDFIDLFNAPISKSELFESCEGEVQEVIDELLALNYIVPIDRNEREYLKNEQKQFINTVKKGKNLSRLELAITDACNLGCSHCMHFINNDISVRTSPTLHMDTETAKNSIDIFIDKVRKEGGRKVRVHFGNGEPLLNWKTFKYCLEYCDLIDDIDFSYAVNTNLTLLDMDKAETLKRYKVKIATSLDGLKDGNDLIRVDLKGRGTFDKILESIYLLSAINHPIEGFTITVTDKNFKNIDERIIDFAQTHQIKDIALDIDLVNNVETSVTEFVEMIANLRKYANSKGINFYGTWETPYRVIMNESWLESPHSFCPAMEGSTIEFGIEGDLKTCGHTNTKIGHASSFEEIFKDDSSFVNLIESRLPGNNIPCIGCEIEGSCAGQCHVTIEATKGNNKEMEVMCNFMKTSTRELLKTYLKGMPVPNNT